MKINKTIVAAVYTLADMETEVNPVHYNLEVSANE